MLAMQCIKNLWRKPAYRQLLNTSQMNDAAAPLNAWREPIQLRVDNFVPSACSFADKINVRYYMCAVHMVFVSCVDDSD